MITKACFPYTYKVISWFNSIRTSLKLLPTIESYYVILYNLFANALVIEVNTTIVNIIPTHNEF